MKRTFALALTAAVAVSLLIAAGTFALFAATSDPVSTTLTAAKLCLTANRDDGDPIPGPMFYVTAGQGQTPPPLPGLDPIPGTHPTGLWAPGDAHSRYLNVQNPVTCSSLNAKLVSVQAVLEPGSYAALADVLAVKVYTRYGSNPRVLVADKPLADYLAGPVAFTYPVTGYIPIMLTGSQQFEFEVTMDLHAGNQFMNQTLIASFAVNAEQLAHNP